MTESHAFLHRVPENNGNPEVRSLQVSQTIDEVTKRPLGFYAAGTVFEKGSCSHVEGPHASNPAQAVVDFTAAVLATQPDVTVQIVEKLDGQSVAFYRHGMRVHEEPMEENGFETTNTRGVPTGKVDPLSVTVFNGLNTLQKMQQE